MHISRCLCARHARPQRAKSQDALDAYLEPLRSAEADLPCFSNICLNLVADDTSL
jgi:hypothetical protein